MISRVGTEIPDPYPYDRYMFKVDYGQPVMVSNIGATLDTALPEILVWNNMSIAPGESVTFIFTVETDPEIYLNTGSDVSYYQIPTPVPEPETYAMMLAGLGLVGLAALRRGVCATGRD